MAGLCEGGNEPPGSLKASRPRLSDSRKFVKAMMPALNNPSLSSAYLPVYSYRAKLLLSQPRKVEWGVKE
ncbi:hypothetical protein ANN_19721 [Periplaneta americana]|uniref:Uncharacterized protein n=1 Tax=Periplaneta americana TaxID=6978 RepID=A0ABQ8SAN2_PERAM|nr:hypothetical protein ANN_19721 [Periplaneta americana]